MPNWVTNVQYDVYQVIIRGLTMNFALRLPKWFLLSAGLCAGNLAFALDNVTLQLKWTHQFQFAGYYAAIEQGYYREAGMNVQLEEGSGNTDVIKNVVDGSAQFGIGLSNLLLARSQGKPVVVLAPIFQHSPYALFAAKNKGIASVRDLAGKPIRLDAQSEELSVYLKKEGLSLDNVKIMPNSLSAEDLVSGRIDALSGYISNEPYYFERIAYPYQIFSPRDAGIDFYGDILFTSEQEIRKHPERVRAFREASLRGWFYATNHRDEMIALILRKYAKQQSRDHLLYEAEQINSLIHSDLIDIGYSNPQRWKLIASAYADAGMLPQNFSMKGFIYDDHPADNATLYRILGASLLAIALSSLTAAFFYRLSRRLKLSIQETEKVTTREHARTRILELLVTGAALPDILKVLVNNVEAQDPRMLCSILLVDKSGRRLITCAAPSLPEFYNSALDGMQIAPSAGPCGASAYSGKRTVTENIQTHANGAPCMELAGQAGLASCWSEPIISSCGKTLGVFAVYHRETRSPGVEEIKLLEQAAHLAGIVIERITDTQALQRSHDMLTKISGEVPGMIFQYRLYPDGHSCFPFMSETVRKMHGVTPEDLREDAHPVLQHTHPEDAAQFYESIRESARNLSHWSVEYRIILPIMGMRWRLGNARPEKLEDGSVLWHGFITDITERKIAEEQIRHMAQYDALTDLPNRALLTDRLLQALATAKRDISCLAIMFLDLDKFKPINDTLGHAIGDVLLQRVATVIQSCVRESDTVARIGGDEFIVLLPYIETEQDALNVAEKIRQALDRSFEIDGYVLKISSSIGVALYPEHGENEFNLTKHADVAMYYSKQNGKNRASLYHSGMKVVGQ